ncbi:PREDICTED: xylulose kinase-like [Ceratosolen solmsi marchali]|uniref:Xylulose kinase n=1 Tax=Ceratosolen solmsi marchali TaxID=326594 RepID=A0AAJ6YV91_9HYME|nr:PREDICTED: xylulose kinase-like [Ceratosolen solmsi marchali]
MGESKTSTFLGFDFSTQQLKAVVVDYDLNVLHETSVQYDNDLPEFRTYGGVLQTKDEPNVITVPTHMWVKALDMILDRLRVCGVDFSKVAAISGSAQQHGTVYWSKGSQKTLQNLNPEKFLHEQLVAAFSITPAPIWMDSSTSIECKHLEEVVGGPNKLAEITGSQAHERFSGPQIAKIFKKRPEALENTERISLVSSFAASLLLGNYAPIDWADGSGMNLLNIRTKDWSDELLEACAPNLRQKLDKPVPSRTDIGPISTYFVERFGFDEKCRIIAFTGDNPCSLAGMKLKEGDIACSLGTSDTIFLWLNESKTVTEGHVLCNPVQDDAYMALLCFRNGSLTRERIRNSAAGADWRLFNELLDNTPRGNFGNCAFYHDAEEIISRISGDHRFNKTNERIVRYSSKEVEVRALVEGQFIARRAHAEDFGLVIGPKRRIIATGGASTNKTILQVLSDVFNSPVHVSEVVNSAMMGGAYRAKHGLLKDKYKFDDILNSLPEPQLLCRPHDDADRIYKPMVERYKKLLNQNMLQN